MEQKRKISVRKILQVLVTLVVTIGCVVAISSASHKEIGKPVAGMEVDIKNNRHKFVDEQEVKAIMLRANGAPIAGTPVNHLKLRAIEDSIKKNKWVANAEAYIDNKRVVHVRVTQRVPVARIFEENGSSYYIDKTMSIMPVSERYVYYTTVVTGVPHLGNDTTSKALMAQIAHVVRRVERDTFWSAQVSQIVVGADRSFEIVPVLGDQRILLGDTSLLDTKLANLFVFYKNVLSRVGWDRYDVIDLRYKGQIVASPALEWKKPAGVALTDPKWVETIKSKAAYNKNTFTLDSNNVGVISRSVPPPQVSTQAITASAANNGRAAVEQPKPAEKKEPLPPAAGAAPQKATPKPAVQSGAAPRKADKPAVKIGPMPDKAPARKATPPPANKKSATAAKAPAKAVKKETKKEVKKKNDKKAEDKKKTKEHKPDKQENKQKNAKYIYNNNH
ncbi:MAG: hypothetical protein JNL72_00860 [Flavipsychrobacter sp.]|nr:hypothetical protein [Flavipsychrobacter sp.]